MEPRLRLYFCLDLYRILIYYRGERSIDIRYKRGMAMARGKLDTLTEQMYYLLLALHEPGHGYAIMERVRTLSRGRLQLGPGTLYTLLGRFEKEGLITLAATEQNRKVYQLTDVGRETLEREYERLRRQVADGAAVFGRKDGI